MKSSHHQRPAGVSDKARLRSLLCSGRKLEPNVESEVSASIEILEDRQLVVINQREFVLCVNPADEDFDLLEKPDCSGRIYLDDELICSECGRVIEHVEQKQRYLEQMIELNPDGIVSFVSECLQSLPCVTKVIAEERAVFRVELTNGTLCLVALVDDRAGLTTSMKFRYAGQFFAEPVLYILAECTTDFAPHLLERVHFARLEDFLVETEEQLCDRLCTASLPRVREVRYDAVEQLLNQYLATHSWQDFQNIFIPAFYRHCQSHSQLVDTYLTTLKRDKGTFLASFPVTIGGAGKTDFRLIEKLDYLEAIFKGRVIADAKFYTTKRLTSHELDTIIRQLSTDARGSQDAIAAIFVTSDSVDSTVWDNITLLKRNQGDWMVVVVPKYLLLELLYALQATHLLQ